MIFWEGFFLGFMVAYTPSLIVLVLLLWNRPWEQGNYWEQP